MENRKQEQLNQWLNSPLAEGDRFYHKKYPNRQFHALGFSQGNKMICGDSDEKTRITFNYKDPNIFKVAGDFQGVNPFYKSTIRFVNFGLSELIRMTGYDSRNGKMESDSGMPYFNWNPYFVINGKKEHYQRGYVWSLEQKQALINTIYRNLEAGRIIFHRHDWFEQEKMIKLGFTDFAHHDIIDGKQRLSTMIQFIKNEFFDENGNFYSDLSDHAKRAVMSYQGFSFGYVEGVCSPEVIADIFLNNACAGTPISKEHIDYMIKIKESFNK